MTTKGTCRPEAKLRLQQESLCKAVEAQMAGASALLEAETLLDSKGSDYILGFLGGLAHCLQLGELFDASNSEEGEGPV